MQMQSPTAGATRRRSISGVSSAKNSPSARSGEKSSSVLDSEVNSIPVPDYPPPAPPSTPTLPSSKAQSTSSMLTPIVSNSPYTNYHLESYSKYAHIIETPSTPALSFATGTAEELLMNNQQPATPDRGDWTR